MASCSCRVRWASIGYGAKPMSQDGSRLGAGLAWIEESRSLGSFAKTVTTSLGALVAFGLGSIIAMGDAAVGVVTRLFDAFGVGGEAWIYAMLVDPAGFISESWNQAGASLSNSAFAELGPFLPIIAAISALGFLYIITGYLDRRDSDVPGLGIDLPIIGNDEEGEGMDLPIIGNSEEDD